MITARDAKGIARFLVDSDVEDFTLHLTRLAPRTASHPPHTHPGTEAFYILGGLGVVVVGGERHELGPNEAIVIDARKPHGISNPGDAELSYLVVNAKGR